MSADQPEEVRVRELVGGVHSVNLAFLPRWIAQKAGNQQTAQRLWPKGKGGPRKTARGERTLIFSFKFCAPPQKRLCHLAPEI